jgi:hypothetical protein
VIFYRDASSLPVAEGSSPSSLGTATCRDRKCHPMFRVDLESMNERWRLNMLVAGDAPKMIAGSPPTVENLMSKTLGLMATADNIVCRTIAGSLLALETQGMRIRHRRKSQHGGIAS